MLRPPMPLERVAVVRAHTVDRLRHGCDHHVRLHGSHKDAINPLVKSRDDPGSGWQDEEGRDVEDLAKLEALGHLQDVRTGPGQVDYHPVVAPVCLDLQ